MKNTTDIILNIVLAVLGTAALVFIILLIMDALQKRKVVAAIKKKIENGAPIDGSEPTPTPTNPQ